MKVPFSEWKKVVGESSKVCAGKPYKEFLACKREYIKKKYAELSRSV